MTHLKKAIEKINAKGNYDLHIQLDDDNVYVYDGFEMFDFDAESEIEMLDKALEQDTFKGNYFDFECCARMVATKNEI